MKTLIVSDTHGRITNLEKVINKVKPIDLLIHLGDFTCKPNYIKDLVNCEVELIAGNNDVVSEAERQKIIVIGRYKILLTHGDRYRVNMGIEFLKQYALNNEIDIVMFGHTHKPVIEYEDGIAFVNPGSLSEPRQDNRKPSFMIMEIDRNGEVHFTKNFIT